MPTEKTISILGLKGAGKSTFLAVLNLALALENSAWRIRAVGETKERMATLRTSMSKGEYPDQTREETAMEFFVDKEESMLGLKAGAQFRLKAADVPGEAVKGIGSDNALYKNFYERRIKGCSGIIFLLDCKEAWLLGKQNLADGAEGDDYLPLFTSIIEQIFEQVDVNPYVVFCVTKAEMDEKYGPDTRFGEDKRYDRYVEELAEKILGKNAKAVIDHGFDNDHVNWLPISATGFTERDKSGKRLRQWMDHPNSEGKSLIRNPKELKPINVAEALEWVLDRLADEDEDVRTARTRGKFLANLLKSGRKLFGNK